MARKDKVDFESYLMEYYIKNDGNCILDKHDIPDAFDEWLVDIDLELIIELANIFAHDEKLKTINNIEKSLAYIQSPVD